MCFYVYAHRKADTGEIFYIGKGTRRRAWSVHGRSTLWTRTAKKHGLIVEILKSDLTEREAFDFEVEMIAAHDGLCNHTAGGEGITGLRHTEAIRAAMSAARKGKPQKPEHVEARTLKLRGLKRSPEIMARWVNPMKGKKHSLETRAKMSASNTGRRNPQESIDRVAEFHRGRKRPPATRARMSEAQPKKPVRCVETGEIFPSLTAAAKWARTIGHPKANKTGIWHSATGRHIVAYGHRWEYA